MIFLLSPEAWQHRDELGGTEYLATIRNTTAGDAPHLDLDEEAAVQEAMQALIRAGLVQSAHDISDGGLAVNLAESVIFSDLGADVQLSTEEDLRLDAILFGEAQSRIVFTARADDGEMIMDTLVGRNVQAVPIGHVTAEAVLRVCVNEETVIEKTADALRKPYESALPAAMGG